MALRELEVRDLTTAFFNAGIFVGVWAKQSNNLLGGIRPFMYNDRTDQLIVHEADNDMVMWCDPQFDPPATTERNRLVVSAPNPIRAIVAGHYDRTLGVQKIYGSNLTSTNTPFSELGDDLQESVLEPYPNFGRENHVSFPSSQLGYYDSADDGGMLIFENWKGGTAISGNCRARDAAGIHTNVMAEIDLATGFATPIAIAVKLDGTPANSFQEPIRFGDEMDFRDIQFVPDADDSPQAPKGFFMLWTERQNLLVEPTGASPGTARAYFKFHDFNPTGKAAAPGSPSRVHLRETLFSRLFMIEDTAPGSGGIGEIAGIGEKFWDGDATFYHPPTRTVRQLFSSAGAGLQQDQVLVVHSQIPALASVGGPSPEGTVETGKTTSWQVTLKGDLGEPVSDLGVAFVLKRGSTIDETFDTSSGTETDVTVANPPIDADTLVFKNAGVPLTITTDYTVVEATGMITGVGAHSPLLASGYTADYEHRNTPVIAPHGALVGASAESDQNGIAETRVRYPFDPTLDFGLEEIEATVEDQV